MSAEPEWRFREMSPGDINIDPIEGEFFTTEAEGLKPVLYPNEEVTTHEASSA